MWESFWLTQMSCLSLLVEKMQKEDDSPILFSLANKKSLERSVLFAEYLKLTGRSFATGHAAALQKCGTHELGLTSAMWERFVAEKTEELRDAFDQAVKEIHPETKIISRRHVEVSVKSAELHAVLLGPKEVEEVQATMGGLECCLKSGEGGGFSQRKKRVLIVCIKFSWHKVM